MDREIPKEIRKKERNKKIIRFSAIAVTIVVVQYSDFPDAYGSEEKRHYTLCR